MSLAIEMTHQSRSEKNFRSLSAIQSLDELGEMNIQVGELLDGMLDLLFHCFFVIKRLLGK